MRPGERVTRPDGTRTRTMRGVFSSRVRHKRPEFCDQWQEQSDFFESQRWGYKTDLENQGWYS